MDCAAILIAGFEARFGALMQPESSTLDVMLISGLSNWWFVNAWIVVLSELSRHPPGS